MKKTNYKFVIGVAVFILSILLTALLLFNQSSQFLCWAVFCCSLIYLLCGWFFFKGYHQDGHPLLLFLFGYLYSGVFISFFFWSKGLPLTKTFVVLAAVWAIIQTFLILTLKKKIPLIGFRQFIIEGLILVALSALLIIRIF